MILNFDYLPIKFKYDYVYNFSENKAKVKLNDKQGIIDQYGNEITEIKYDYIWDFNK